jgi:hypothetical protein
MIVLHSGRLLEGFGNVLDILQGDSEGKDNNLGDYIVGHCEEKLHKPCVYF